MSDFNMPIMEQKINPFPFGDEKPKRNIDMDQPIIINIDGQRFEKSPVEAMSIAGIINATVQCWIMNNGER